jgi:ribonuclease HII
VAFFLPTQLHKILFAQVLTEDWQIKCNEDMIELKYITKFPAEVIATDEVGRGPLSGPVVVGGVRILVENPESLKAFLKFLRLKGIKDSKKLSQKDRQDVLTTMNLRDPGFRQKAVIKLKGLELSYISWDMSHEKIDELNILAASLEGMKEAALALSEMKNISTTVFIDGHQKLRWGMMSSPWNEIPVIKGDTRSVLIGLASIIAKQKRDSFMKEMHELYPQYGFSSHFGYPTKEHRQAIKCHGPCAIHRKTFKGVKEFIRT